MPADGRPDHAHHAEHTDGPDADRDQPHHPRTAAEWDDRYRERDLIWSGRVNGTLVAEVADLTPGRALDVGCGEGADAIWLAARGWQVTGLDLSQVALARAQAAALAAGAAITWVNADVVAAAPDLGVFDLVTAHYAVLPHTEDRAGQRALTGYVAPGGTLLVVGHARMPGEHTGPDDRVEPDDLRDHLGAGWTVLVHETRPRPDAPPDAPHSHDVVLRATRA